MQLAALWEIALEMGRVDLGELKLPNGTPVKIFRNIG